MLIAIVANKHSELVANKIGFINILIRSKNKKISDFLIYLWSVLAAVVMSRWASNVTLCLPHVGGRYLLLKQIIKHDKIVLIDDGKTFEYWSEFHEGSIKPLLYSDKFDCLIGCGGVGSWVRINPGHKLFTRSEVWRDYLNIRNGAVFEPKPLPERVIYIDDGDDINLERNKKIITALCEEKQFIEVVMHPSRRGLVDQPIELQIVNLIKEGFKINLYGEGSTALYNLSSFPEIKRSLKLYNISGEVVEDFNYCELV